MISTQEIQKISDTIEHVVDVLENMKMPMGYPEEEGDNMSDLGGEDSLDDAIVDDDDDDVIDDFLNDLVDMISEEYEEDSALAAVEDAIRSLVDDQSIEMVPGPLEPDDVKIRWIWNAMPKIKLRLKEFGLDYDDSTLNFYEIGKE